MTLDLNSNKCSYIDRTARWIAVGAVVLGLAVAFGAFGAHGLRSHLSEPDMAIYQTAVLYQSIHGLAIILTSLTGLAFDQQRSFARVCASFLLSILVFSGTLYLLVLTNQRWLGAITPLGGAGFMVSWLWLSVACLRSGKRIPVCSGETYSSKNLGIQ